MAATPSGRSAGLLPTARTIAVGAVGGAAFAWMGLPLPWMLGSMTAATCWALAGMRVAMPRRLRTGFVTVLGVMLGASFTPAAMARFPGWAATIAGLLLFAAVASALAWIYFRRVAGFDRVTSFFAAMPGGLNEMVLLGDRFGGDQRRIALVHATRVFVTVFTIPIWFQWHDGFARGGGGGGHVALSAIGLDDYLVLAACALGGWAGAARLGIPAGAVVGPMILSAAVHLAGITESAPPTLVVSVAQIVIGATLGCQFVGFSLAAIAKTILHGAVAGALMVGAAVIISGLLAGAVGLPATTVLLGFAPGGLAEMSLVAIALGVDAVFVATHHIARIVMVVVLAPPIFRALRPRS
jgi:membrane AbrB-like protein